MKKTIVFFGSLCFSALMMCACVLKNTQRVPACRVVTGVDISCRQQDVHIQRHYTDHKKMQSVLLYLRLLEPLGKPEADPDAVDSEVYEITVHLSDGMQRNYRQKAHRYFCRETQPWKTIAPEQAAKLYELMRYMPSDTTFSITNSPSAVVFCQTHDI